MNIGVQYEREQLLNEIKEKKISNYQTNVIKPINIKEYMNIYCTYMINDLKMISLFYEFNCKKIFAILLQQAYTKMMFYPRLRANYKNKSIELYSNKKGHGHSVYEVKIFV